MSAHGRRSLPLLCAVIALGLAPAARAATLQVAPGGSGDCRSSACGSFSDAYGAAGDGDVISVAAGRYAAQTVPGGTKRVTFQGVAGAKVDRILNDASNVTFDGVEVDGQGGTDVGFETNGDNDSFRDARIGNVVDTKGSQVSGSNFTFDNVEFHDVVLKTDGVHLECVYAIVVPNMIVRNSTFRNCAVMDLFFTYGTWWTPLPPAYGGVTIENNVFGHTTNNSGGWNYYTLYVGMTGPNGDGGDPMSGWTVRNNTFEIDAFLSSSAGTNGTRWVGNLGAWNCLGGVSFHNNVGDKCGASDRAVSPSASTPSTAAALGWLDPGHGDFHLRSNSPAVGAGDPADHPATDRDGGVRDAKPDAGAYEFGAKRPGGGTGGPGSGAPGATGTTPGSGSTGARGWSIRSAKLRPRTICHRPRHGCPASTSVLLRLGRRARVTLRVERLRKGHKPKRVRRVRLAKLKRHKSARIRAKGLRAGRYRVVVIATDAAGRRSKPVLLKLRVR